MRTGLIILGVIFLVIGGIFYFYPSQKFSAQTTTGQSNPVNSSARFQVPVEWSYALVIIGIVFLLSGSVISSPVRAIVQSSTPATQTHTIIAGTPGPRGPRGSKGTKGNKGKTQSAKTVIISQSGKPRRKGKSQRGKLVTTTTTREI